MNQSTGGTGAEARLRRQRATLADFGLYAFRAEDLDELLNEAAQRVSHALDVDLVKIMEWRPERGDFLVRAGVNWKPGVVGRATLGGDSQSPAGYALERNEPVISPDTSAETRFKIPQLLKEHGVRSMVNVIIVGEDEPFGVFEVDAPEKREFDVDDIAFLRNYANLLAAAVERLRAHRALEQTAEERRVLVRELQHRVKNILALVQSFAMLTSAEGRSAEEFRDVLLGRLHALARAHSLFSEARGRDVGLDGLVGRVVEPYRADRPEAVAIAGENGVMLDAKQGLTLGLMLHELATNAAKYGALSVPDGQVLISWRVERPGDAPHLHLAWRESGGPPVAPPRHRGFGTRMIERAGSYELDGRAEVTHLPEGLRAEVSFPLAARSSGYQG